MSDTEKSFNNAVEWQDISFHLYFYFLISLYNSKDVHFPTLLPMSDSKSFVEETALGEVGKGMNIAASYPGFPCCFFFFFLFVCLFVFWFGFISAVHLVSVK